MFLIAAYERITWAKGLFDVLIEASKVKKTAFFATNIVQFACGFDDKVVP